MPLALTEMERTQISNASQRLDSWIEGQRFAGWDPFDALNSPLLHKITFGKRRLGQIWVQLFKHSPVNLRMIFGVPKVYNAKGMGLFLGAYIRKWKLCGQPSHLEHVKFLSHWLLTNTSPGYHGACWGYPFDWPNRDFYAPKGVPTIVNTAFIGLALKDTLPGMPGNQLPDELRITSSILNSVSDFILTDLNRAPTAPDEICFSYTPLDNRWIHNANLLGGWLLAEIAVENGNDYLAEMACKAARYTIRRQREDGFWPYGEGHNNNWVDNFHTGYILDSLAEISNKLQTTEFTPAIEKGYSYWKKNFFLSSGMPKYYTDRTYPVDGHCVAQGILTFLRFLDDDPEAAQMLKRLAFWGIEQLQTGSGFFDYQIYSGYRNKIPYMRWIQAWMQRALTELLWTDALENGLLDNVAITSMA